MAASSKDYTASNKNKRKFNPKKNESDDLSSSTKKRALKQARQSHRPHAEVVVASKELWNKLRVKNNTQDDIKVMMDELMDLLRGKFNRIALQHDASRVVQSAIQFGNKEQRVEILKELCDAKNIIELSKSQYSHFVVLKMIKYCRDDKSMNMLVKVRLP
jgi:pumilio family protein 6